MTIPIHRYVAVGRFPISVVNLLKFTQAFIAALTGNTFFPDAAALVTAITAAFHALDTAETAAKSRAVGTVAARNAARTTLLTVLHGGKAYVQSKADANIEQAQAIIESATFAVRKQTARVKLAFSVKQGPVSGSAQLTAKTVARRAFYEWQWSADAGKTWTTLPTTLQAKTVAFGLPVGTTCSFRFRAGTKAGEGDFSQVVTLLVK